MRRVSPSASKRWRSSWAGRREAPRRSGNRASVIRPLAGTPRRAGAARARTRLGRRRDPRPGSNPHATIAGAKDRIDGEVGLAALVLGFATQAAAYVVDLLYYDPGPDPRTNAAVSAGTTVAAFILVLAAIHWLGPQRLPRLLVGAASIDLETGAVQEHPFGPRLQGYADLTGHEARPGETTLDYLRRVYGVDDLLYGDPPNRRRASEMDLEPIRSVGP